MIELALTPYHVAFRASVRDATGARSERHGAVLSLTAGGARGASELAPLPGRSRESLDACSRALQALAPLALDPDDLAGNGWLDAVRRAAARLPAELAAARHALETALLDLAGALRGLPAPQLLAQALGRAEPAARLPVAALVDALDPDEAAAQAALAAAQGITTLKLKIAGSESDAAIVGRVRRLRSAFRLRVDANRSLSAEQCQRLLPILAEAGVEFIEEPSAALPAPMPLPLALDESLLDPDFSLERSRRAGAAVLVLKPMVLGFVQALDLARAAGDAGLEIVLSHTFDGPRAMAAARSLALALGPRRHADGLAAHAALRGELPRHVTAPRLEAWTSPGLGVP